MEQVCQHFTSIATGGGQNRKKETPSGRPSGVTPTTVITQMKDIAPTSFFPPPSSSDVDPPPPKYIVHPNEDMECSLCLGVPERNLVCLACCCKWVEVSCGLTCPSCHTAVLTDHFQRPSRVTMSVLGSLLVDCAHGVQQVCEDRELQTALAVPVSAPLRPVHRFFFTSYHTRQILTTPAERKVAGNVIRRIMTESADTGVIKVPTQGLVSSNACRNSLFISMGLQPLTLMPVPQCRKKLVKPARRPPMLIYLPPNYS